MPYRFIFLIVIIAFLSVSSNSFGGIDHGLNTALSSFQKGEFKKSKVQFIQLLKKDKKNPVYWFNLGHVMMKLSDYSKALKYYGKVISLNSPLAPAGRYYRAKALIELGRIGEARKELQAVIAENKLPQNLKTNATALSKSLSTVSGVEDLALKKYQENNYVSSSELLKSIPPEKLSQDAYLLLMMDYAQMDYWEGFQRIKRRFFRMPTVSNVRRTQVLELEKIFSKTSVATKPFTLFLDASVGNNSNAYADGESVEPVDSMEYRLYTGGTYQWGLGGDKFMKAGYTFFKNSFDDASNLDSHTHTGRLSYLNIEGRNSFEVTPYVQLTNWDGINVSNSVGIMSLNSFGGESNEKGFLIDLSKRNSIDETYSYLDSTSLSGRGFMSWWTAMALAELNLSAGYDGTQDVQYSDGGRLPLTHFFYGPGMRIVLRPSDSVVATALAAYLMREYQNPSRPEGKTRSDKELSYSLRGNYYFLPSTSIYLQFEGLHNESTLGANDVRDKNYNVVTQSLGITWDYL